jgi:hypothetical protein
MQLMLILNNIQYLAIDNVIIIMSIANFLLFGGLRFGSCGKEYKKEVSSFNWYYDDRIANISSSTILDSNCPK